MQEFVVYLVRTLISLVGKNATKTLLAELFPAGEFQLDAFNNLETPKEVAREHSQKLVGGVTEYVVKNFGREFTENLLKQSYAFFEQNPPDKFQTVDVLESIPMGFLEERKVRLLSKEELETRVLQRTKELQNLNLTLEARVVERTKELASANRNLEEKNKQLENLSKAKTEFVSLVTHQLLTPLSSLRMALYELRDSLKNTRNKDAKEFIPKMITTNERLIELVQNLLNVARIEEGRLLYNFQDLPIDSLIKEVVATLEPKAKEKNITLNYHEGPRLPTIKADKEKLYLAMENIIANAINYTPPKNAIDIEQTLSGHSILLKVRDKGIGIPEQEKENIFQKFYRATNAVRAGQGTGLGLFIAKQIIQAHGGKISFESAEGKSTTFFIEIPTSSSLNPVPPTPSDARLAR